MHESGKKLLSNCDLRSYYGVGSPSPMPFENDIIKKNLTDGHVLLCYSYLAKGYFQKADNEIKKVIESDKNDFRAYVYSIIKEFIC
jgi:Tfp pilus assembly protein PilF